MESVTWTAGTTPHSAEGQGALTGRTYLLTSHTGAPDSYSVSAEPDFIVPYIHILQPPGDLRSVKALIETWEVIEAVSDGLADNVSIGDLKEARRIVGAQIWAKGEALSKLKGPVDKVMYGDDIKDEIRRLKELGAKIDLAAGVGVSPKVDP
ncbi:MAG: hypothetical protein JWL84_5454 [Rhodospirillales bacterium]|nr:hypothetical protein [Rhodospirillales bacterium]